MKVNRTLSAIMLVTLASAQPGLAFDGRYAVERTIGTAVDLMLICTVTDQCNSQRRNSPTSNTANPRRPSVPVVRVQPNPIVAADQRALTYFGFEPGVVDGLPGRKTTGAIQTFQSRFALPVTGVLTDLERLALTTAQQRAELSGARGYGERQAQLDSYYRQMRGTPEPIAPSLPNWTDSSPRQSDLSASMAEHCNLVAILTGANGGRMRVDNLSDPQLALNEQFCAARDYAVSRGAQLAGGQELDDRCASLVADMRGIVPKITNTAPAGLASEAAAKLSRLGVSVERQRQMGEICLGTAYRTDDSEMALASASVLLASGNSSYAEVFGHHVRLGFGVTANQEQAVNWYLYGLDGLRNGGQPAFLPVQSSERSAIIEASIAVAQPRATNVGAAFTNVEASWR